jgi:lysozyme family protein
VRLLQEAAGAFPDGAIGPAMLRAVRGVNDIAALVDRLAAGRIAFYGALRTFAAFGRGWVKRVEQVRQKARGKLE